MAIYRRTSLPFRWVFKGLAYLRSRPPRHLFSDTSDAYLGAHTQDFFKDRWLYGYHRVFDLLRHFQPADDPALLKVLSLGPRSEIELYYLWLLFGFSWRNLVGADLVSTSPKIELADFSQRLPFSDDTFDVVIASHSLEKSRDPVRTRDEIRRVSKPGARVLVCGNRVPEDTVTTFPYKDQQIPVHYFREGVYGFMDLYEVPLGDIEYLNAHSPHGFNIIFRIRKQAAGRDA